MAIKIKMASILFIYLKSYVVTLLANSLVIVSCPENQPTNLLIHIFCIQRIDVSFLFVSPLSSPLLFLRNVWGHIVFFFCRRRPAGQRFQAPKHAKASTICGLFSILRKTDQAKVSSTNFRETLLPTASFVCCQLDM